MTCGMPEKGADRSVFRFERGLRPRNDPGGRLRKGGEAPLRVSSNPDVRRFLAGELRAG
jgi:hypothetical protein